jgi:hypothetical protein
MHSHESPSFPVVLKGNGAMDTFAAYLKAFGQLVEALPKLLQQSLLDLGQQGWYFGGNFTVGQSQQLIKRVNSTPKEQRDGVLCDWVDEQLGTIEHRLSEEYQNRALIFEQAFWAHRNQKYALSVPALLAQADGICKQRLGVLLFDGSFAAIKRIAKRQALNGGTAIMLAPLIEKLAIVESENLRLAKRQQLNRHAILHGESTDYGVREVGCKAVLYLDYVNWGISALANARSEASRGE